MTDLSQLIERVEAATGPDRRLDALIDCAIRFPDLRPARPDDHKEYQRGFPPGQGDIWCPTGFLMARSYTRSMDDVLSLMPEGIKLDLILREDGTGYACAWTHHGNRSSNGATLTLAALTAILKARQTAAQPANQAEAR